MSVSTFFKKDPDGVLDYTVRWTAWLNTDTIATSSWVLPGGDLVKTAESNTTLDAVIWLASGSVGQIYEVTNRIITAAGRQDERTISILVEDK